MIYDFQKASILKRISAFLLDFILVTIVATGVASLVSVISGYDNYSDSYIQTQIKYQEKYNISFEDPNGISAEDSQKEGYAERYKEAYEALIADKKAMNDYQMTVNLTFLSVSIGIFMGFLLVEFVAPLIIGNGQTVGKKIFAIAVIRLDGIKASNVQLFIRAILGKYTIETMIPLMLLAMSWFGYIHPYVGIGCPVILLIIQAVLFFSGKDRGFIHDKMSMTASADKETQLIFADSQAREEYIAKKNAESSAKDPY